MSKIKRLNEFVPNRERKLSQEELLQILKNGQYTVKELNQMGASELQVIELRQLGYRLMYQYDKLKKGFVYYILEKGEIPYTLLPCKNEKSLKLAELSDVHIGSNEVDNEELILLLTYLWKKGYRILTISGDLTDGIHVYRSHSLNLDLTTADQQAETVVAILSMFNFQYICCGGNHDESGSNHGAARVLSLIEEKMVNKGKSFTYLKAYTGYIVWKDSVIGITHMDGSRGNTQSETYASQRLLDSTFKSSLKDGDSNVNYVRVGNKMLPMVKLITGHYHALARFVYGNVVCESPLTLQHTTDFIIRRGITSKTGCRTSIITVENGKIVSDIGSIIFSRDVADIFETENRYKKSKKRAGIVITANETESIPQDNMDSNKINVALKKLFRKRYMNFDELGLTMEEIKYINSSFNYNIYVDENNTVVLKTDTSSTSIIFSPLPESGIVNYMELANFLVGSCFFNEAALRYMLDEAKAQGVKHIHLGGDIVWGIPNKKQVEFTKIFHTHQQVAELIRIFSDYPEFKYYAINGAREMTCIEAKEDYQRINPMKELATGLNAKGIEFTAINSNICDFVIMGTIFRMINLQKFGKRPYTRDVDIMNAQRALLAKKGNRVTIDDNTYNIGAIFYSSVPNTQETHSGGIYVTTVGGPSCDLEGVSDMVQSNSEGSIISAYVQDGEIVKFEREIVMSPV